MLAGDRGLLLLFTSIYALTVALSLPSPYALIACDEKEPSTARKLSASSDTRSKVKGPARLKDFDSLSGRRSRFDRNSSATLLMRASQYEPRHDRLRRHV